MNTTETRRPTKFLAKPIPAPSVGAQRPHPTNVAPKPMGEASGGDPNVTISETRRPTMVPTNPNTGPSVGAPTPHPTNGEPKPNGATSGGDPSTTTGQPVTDTQSDCAGRGPNANGTPTVTTLVPHDYTRLSRDQLDVELQAASRAAQEQAEATQIPETRQTPPNKPDREH